MSRRQQQWSAARQQVARAEKAARGEAAAASSQNQQTPGTRRGGLEGPSCGGQRELARPAANSWQQREASETVKDVG